MREDEPDPYCGGVVGVGCSLAAITIVILMLFGLFAEIVMR